MDCLHCLSAFGSVVTQGVLERVRAPRCLHCLSAFGSVVTQHHHLPQATVWFMVSIAFRRLVQSSPVDAAANTLLLDNESPLPFGVWFSRHLGFRPTRAITSQRVSIAFRRLVQSSRHGFGIGLASALPLSPLPFGVWFSRHMVGKRWKQAESGYGLHCLSAFGSVVTRQGDRSRGAEHPVSIAFRRLVQSSPSLRETDAEKIICLHCLSAFGSVVTGKG